MKLSALAASLLICVMAFAQRPTFQAVQKPPGDERGISEIAVERRGTMGGGEGLNYTLTLRRQGSSTYIGKTGPRRGLYLAKLLWPGDFDRLSKTISELGFFDLPNEVGPDVIDAEVVVVRVTTSSQSKTVKASDFARAPFAFWAVVMLADGMAANLTWQNPNQPKDGIVGPFHLNEVRPRYTEQARQAGLEGSVVLQVEVRPDGTVVPDSINVIQGLGMGLDEQAVEAVKQWIFKPAYRNEKALGITMAVTVAVQFRL